MSAVRLVAEPDNPHDPDAVAICDASGRIKAGYVPRTVAAGVRFDLEHDLLGQSVVAWQWRDPTRVGRPASAS
jgi:hypothetical protein